MGGLGLRWAGGAMAQMTTQIFVLNLGMNPVTMNMIVAVKTIYDGLNDIVMGRISDRWQGRVGRRRPFIALGGVLYGLVLMAHWWLSDQWSMTTLFIWYVAGLFLLETTLTIVNVPYFALGMELSSTYHGKTRVMAYREFVGKFSGFVHPWFKTIALMSVFGGILYGARYLFFVLGLIVMLSTVFTAICCRERYQPAPQKREPIFKAVAATANNRHFWRLVAIFIILGAMHQLFEQFSLYINVGYVFQGDQAREARYGAITVMIATVITLVGVPVTARLSRRIGKHRALACMIGLMIIGDLLKLVLYDPQRPWLVFFTPVFYGFGNSGIYAILSSMQADIVDVDELHSGERREGLFGATQSIVMKSSVAMALMIKGGVLLMTGFRPELKVNQSLETYQMMIRISALAPLVCLVAVLALLWRYPLTEKRMAERTPRFCPEEPRSSKSLETPGESS